MATIPSFKPGSILTFGGRAHVSWRNLQQEELIKWRECEPDLSMHSTTCHYCGGANSTDINCLNCGGPK